MARTLAVESAAGRVRAEAIALSDRTADPALGLPVRACGGSRLRFVFQVRRALWRHSHVIYDFAGMGRSHHLLRLSRKPYACWMHGIEVWEHARADYLAVLHRADRLLSNSRYTLNRAGGLHPNLARAKVCWLATESDRDAAPMAVAQRPSVLIVGRIDTGDRPEWPRYKGHDALIRSWPKVVRRFPEARLVIVGDGPGRPQVEALVRASGVGSTIEMRGFVTEAELARCFAEARVFAMPSRGEGFGLVYIEAMRHGLPVIASRHDAAPEVNQDGVTGYNVDLNRPGELSRRLLDLLSNPAMAQRMGAAGRERWRENFRGDSFHDRFLDIMRPWWIAGDKASTAVPLGNSHAID
jgi:phosphatidylinositol alpha-1,6-mannosyltransferase